MISASIRRATTALVEVWNKADLLGEEALAEAQNSAKRRAANAKPIIVSALTGQGCDELRTMIEARLAVGRTTFDIALKPEDGQGLHWLYENTEVMRKGAAADGSLHMRVRVAPERVEPLRENFFRLQAIPQPE